MDATTGYKNRNTLQIVMTYIAVVMTVFSMRRSHKTILAIANDMPAYRELCNYIDF